MENADIATISNAKTALLLANLNIKADLPFELASEVFLRKATDEEIISLKATLNGFANNARFSRTETTFEHERVETKTKGGISGTYKRLPKSDWRYYVVTSDGNNDVNTNIHLAANLTKTPFNLESIALVGQYGNITNWTLINNFFQNHTFSKAAPVTRTQLIDVRNTYDLMMKVITKYPEIKRGISMYDNLNHLNPYSAFHILGLFAIIEMLITHNPYLEDRGDSISHQIQSKIPLLAKRFKVVIDYKKYFGNATEKKIWSALYGYRSSIAHGGEPDFTSNDLKHLKDAQNSIAFMKYFVRNMLRHCMKEPELYRDIKKC